MDLYNRFKNFLGLPHNNNTQNSNSNSGSSGFNIRDDIREVPSSPHIDDRDTFGFNIFCSPLEMHRYFEHQMNEIMKNFGILNDGTFFENHSGSFFEQNDSFGDNPYGNDNALQFPDVEDFPVGDQAVGSLRDQYLKPGYERAIPHKENKIDGDIDGKFDMADLESVLKGTPSQVQPRSFFFGQSVTTKTIQKADGTTETHKIVRDQHGNKEVIVTHKSGDKEYSVITRTNKNGQQEVIENMVNMDEKDKNSFLGKMQSNENLSDGSNWFPFDKFFK